MIAKLSASGFKGVDAFILLGLVSGSAGNWNETIGCRLRILRGFRTNIERFAFLVDLKLSDPMLFDAVLEEDPEMAAMFFEMNNLMHMTDGI